MDKIKPLFAATATATGGRNGHTEASDGSVAANLSVPKEMGGPGKPATTTPEHLFAAGYAACFGGALDLVAKQHKLDASNAKVTCAVSIGPREGDGFVVLSGWVVSSGNTRVVEPLSIIVDGKTFSPIALESRAASAHSPTMRARSERHCSSAASASSGSWAAAARWCSAA